MDELFSEIWAATIERLVDGRWQAQVVAQESCEPSEWAEADTPSEAVRAAIDSLSDDRSEL